MRAVVDRSVGNTGGLGGTVSGSPVLGRIYFKSKSNKWWLERVYSADDAGDDAALGANNATNLTSSVDMIFLAVTDVTSDDGYDDSHIYGLYSNELNATQAGSESQVDRQRWQYPVS